MPYGRTGGAWALLRDGQICLRQTEMDLDAVCARVVAESGYPGRQGWVDEYVRGRHSDVAALEAFGPRDGRQGLTRTNARGCMAGMNDDTRVTSASRDVSASAPALFELIADPAQQPRWDGNDNLATAAEGQRVHGVGDVFTMTTTKGTDRENHVVEFEEGRRIAWRPAEPGQQPPGHLWRWELEPLDDGRTRVTHTYDWTRLTDEKRVERARSTTSDRLRASLDRLADLAEDAGT
jgi:uncharacterized protein YndB with AHSA1/START domain